MTDPYDRTIPIPTAPNLRDLGGLPTDSGKIARGRVFRSAGLGALSDADLPRFAGLGIGTVYDLRTVDENAASPDRIPDGTRQVPLDVLADSSTSIAASLGEFADDPRAFADSLAGGRAQQLFEDTYRDLIRLPSAQRSYRSFFLDLADEERPGAALFHCTTGKDRTGWAAASLLLLLGVAEEIVYEDYLQTNTDLLPALEPMIRNAEAHGVDREVLLPVLGVREEYLAAALTQMRERYSDIHGYAMVCLGLGEGDLERLRARFVA